MILPLYDSSGNRIHLEASIAAGGEGSIHRLSGGSGLLAKIYSSPPDAISQVKLRELVNIQNPALQQFSAWPQKLLFERPQGQKIVGFLMQDFGDSIQLIDLFQDSQRIFHFPQLTWTGLIQIAENVARAVSIVHQQNLVIGDLHPRNILVNKSALPRLIDCDSYQITIKGKVFRSVARLPAYLPPELHGVDVSKLDGTQDHDRFGLAMIIFQCLFMGKNPFAGQFLGHGDLELEAAIKQHRYAYGPGARQRQMAPPTDALRPEHLTPEIAALFERAFLTTKNRPTAAEWMTALTNLKKQLTPCHMNRSHSRLASQSTCPFCDLQQKSGVALFPNANAETIAKANMTFALPPECGQIKTLTFPTVQLPVPPAAIINTNAVLPPKAVEFIRFEISCIVICCIAVLLILFSTRLGFRPTIPAAIAFACAGAAWISHSTSPLHEMRLKLRQQNQQHESNALANEQTVSNYLKSQTDVFNQLILEGENASQQIQHEMARRTKLAAISLSKFEEQQRKDWLRSHMIQPQCLPKLTAVQCKELNAQGLFSAADILPHRLVKATFLAQEQRQQLLDWVTFIQNSFKCPAFRPSLTPGSFRSEFQFYSICTSRVPIVRDRLSKATAIANAIPAMISQNIAYIANQRALAIDADDQILQLQKLHKAAFERTIFASVAGIVLFCAPLFSMLEQRNLNVGSATTESQPNTTDIAEEESRPSFESSRTEVPPVSIESVSEAAYESEDVYETAPDRVQIRKISFPPSRPLAGPPLSAAAEPSPWKSESPENDDRSDRPSPVPPAEPRLLDTEKSEPTPAHPRWTTSLCSLSGFSSFKLGSRWPRTLHSGACCRLQIRLSRPDSSSRLTVFGLTNRL